MKVSKKITRSTNKVTLSPRERQITELIAQGMSSRQIGADLGITLRTVEVHRHHIMAKLGVHNVVQMLIAVGN